MIPKSTTQQLLSLIDIDRIIANIETLEAFQTRHCGWTNAQEVADAVSAMFTDAGLSPIQDKTLDYDFSGDEATYGLVDIIHIIAEIKGAVDPTKIVVISAHHDSYVYGADFGYDGSYGLRSPGADDNATGVTVMAEIAKCIIDSGWRPDYTIRFVSFGGEEIGLVGSGLYCENLTEDILLNINLDMVGYTDADPSEWALELHPYDTDDNALDGGNSYHDRAEQIIPESTSLSVVRGTLNSNSSDSYNFWIRGYNAIYFEETPRTPHYHTDQDLSINLNNDYLAEMAKAVFAVLINFANIVKRIVPMPNNLPSTFTLKLSTLETISAFEKEVNLQAGYTKKWGLASSSSTTYTVTTDNAVAYAIATLATGATATITGTGGAVLDGIIPIPTNQIVSLACYDEADDLIDTFGLNEGNGLSLYGSDGVLTGVLSSVTAWVLCNANRTWQDKIELAQQLLAFDIENTLTQRGIRVDEANGDILVDVVTNPETFRIACDYKALYLIYTDLSNGGLNELFAGKAKKYGVLYDAEFAKAIQRMNLDPSLSGETTVYRAEWIGSIYR